MEHVTEGSWESLPTQLHPQVLGALGQLGFPHMTPVQVPGREGSSGSGRLGAGQAPGGPARRVGARCLPRVPEPGRRGRRTCAWALTSRPLPRERWGLSACCLWL